jgi:hypothetical protein
MLAVASADMVVSRADKQDLSMILHGKSPWCTRDGGLLQASKCSGACFVWLGLFAAMKKQSPFGSSSIKTDGGFWFLGLITVIFCRIS